ncbi:hypothetical protein MB14_07870 [Roseivirga ehrenbergii]|uniref:Uncharacterized protein n=1 Tax=Roseivirga ehrenbergii (strain DSM 102268 / JCM 13514 / KCTC 12282 / NCIMB 14502 / KMM 6017) TaxID=279360 RepID=A0A150WZY0_ROSEK|nr:hypothetical protein MB14_07870 [Roseivirga ehrenbergii]
MVVKKKAPGKTHKKLLGNFLRISSNRIKLALHRNARSSPSAKGIRPIGVPDSKTNMNIAPKTQITTAVVAMALLAPFQAISPGVIFNKKDLTALEIRLKKLRITK